MLSLSGDTPGGAQNIILLIINNIHGGPLLALANGTNRLRGPSHAETISTCHKLREYRPKDAAVQRWAGRHWLKVICIQRIS